MPDVLLNSENLRYRLDLSKCLLTWFPNSPLGQDKHSYVRPYYI